MRKGKDMNYIELESNGTALYENGMTYPINEDGTHDTNSDMGVHIQDCSNEWWSYVSLDDAYRLFPFLAETDLYYTEGYITWAVEMFSIVHENSNEHVNFEDSWIYSNTLGDA